MVICRKYLTKAFEGYVLGFSLFHMVQHSSVRLSGGILTLSHCSVSEHKWDEGNGICRLTLGGTDANPRAQTTLVGPRTAPSFFEVSKIYCPGRMGSTQLLPEHSEKLLNRTEADRLAYPDGTHSDRTSPGHLEPISRTRSNIPHDWFRPFGITGASNIYKDGSTDDAAEV